MCFSLSVLESWPRAALGWTTVKQYILRSDAAEPVLENPAVTGKWRRGFLI
jgi:hypothetical protein